MQQPLIEEKTPQPDVAYPPVQPDAAYSPAPPYPLQGGYSASGIPPGSAAFDISATFLSASRGSRYVNLAVVHDEGSQCM